MIRKIVLGVFIFLVFAPLASAEQNTDQILYQTITQAEADELNIKIPDSETPGFKSLEVQISGMEKIHNSKKYCFVRT
jgi:hypothetical protein